jgi:hypothetical protein
MALEANEIISAQVVMRTAAGQAPGDAAPITAANIREHAPAAEAVARVADALSQAGFDVGALAGVSFSITGPVDLFRRVFQAPLRRRPDGGVEVVRQDGAANSELPLDALPASYRSLIAAVVFPPPPEWMP